MVLKRFIKIVGVSIVVSGVALGCLILSHGLWNVDHAGLGWWPVFCSFLFGGFISVVFSLIGWRMVAGGNEPAIAEYAFLQALFTGIAVGQLCHYFYPGAHIESVGFIVMVVLARPLKAFIVQHVNMPPGTHPTVMLG